MLRAIIIALSLFWAGPVLAQNSVGPTNQIICNKTAFFSSINAATQMVAPVSGQRVFICGWHVSSSSATTSSFQFTAGTQTTNPCDTGTINLTPSLSVLNSSPSVDHIDFVDIQTNPSQGVCVTPSATTLTGILYYTQF